MTRHLTLVVVLVGCAPAHADRSPTDGAGVLGKYCARCHTGKHARADFDYVDDPARLIANGMVIPGDAAHSLVFRRVEAGEMPPPGVKARPSAAEQAVLRAWIDGLPVAAAPVRSQAELDRLLAADRAALDRDAEPHARWFTLTHLAGAGVPEAQLETYRIALTELLASLSWAPAPPVPVAVDPERTIFRIDLRELGWSAATWDAIRADYPYGVARPDGVPDSIRADWFVATASRAPLYHTILGLPDSEAGLARLLGIDIAADIAAGRVARAGFNGSGVSVNNRVLERHSTRHGALWRSYDFASSVGDANVFEHPLDFVPAGGELIFNLPDGLQAYMLVDGKGHRLDKAPTKIVSDPRRPDRAVETALSCMTCHAGGIIDRADQVRDAAAGSLDAADRTTLAELYPRSTELTAVYAADRARFVDGLAALGLTPATDQDEPITALATRYEAELDLRLAAAELGLRPGDIVARLGRSRELRKTLAAFTVEGGTVKRDTWAAVFAVAVSELGAGVPFTPRGGEDRSPVVWIDRDHHTWSVGGTAAGADQRGAVAACRRLGFELPRATELTTVLAQGLSAGIRLSSGSGSLWTAGTKLDATNQRYAIVVDPEAVATHRADVSERHEVVCVQR